MKKCFKCGACKALHDFYKHRKMRDGHLNKCKECTKKDVIKYRRENDSVREYDRVRAKSPKRRENSTLINKRWRKENPEGYKAHSAVSNAVRSGILVKSPCEVCGCERVHAHHDDYSKPLSVRWLCALHHHRFHSEERKENDKKP